MATYVNTQTNEYPVHIGDIMLAHPGSDENNLPSHFEVVEDTPYPDCGEFETVNVTGVEKVNGIWRRVFLVRAMTEEEIQTRATTKAMLDAQMALPNAKELSTATGSAPNVIG